MIKVHITMSKTISTSNIMTCTRASMIVAHAALTLYTYEILAVIIYEILGKKMTTLGVQC